MRAYNLQPNFLVAHCTPLSVPDGIFEQIPVSESLNSSGGTIYSYEFRDWSQGTETVDNSIIYNGSLFRIPQAQVAAQALGQSRQDAGIQITMSKGQSSCAKRKS